jgi:hypothetical protein
MAATLKIAVLTTVFGALAADAMTEEVIGRQTRSIQEGIYTLNV